MSRSNSPRRSFGAVAALVGLIVIYGIIRAVSGDVTNAGSAASEAPPAPPAHVAPAAPPSHWPPPSNIAGRQPYPAPAALIQFGMKTAKAQLRSFRTGKFDAAAMAAGRFDGSNIIPDHGYFVWASHTQPTLEQSTGVTLESSAAQPGKPGVWLTLKLKEPHGTTDAPFYANPTYTPSLAPTHTAPKQGKSP